MSELIQATANRKDTRWKLLLGASTLSFAAYLGSAAPSLAEDQDKPQVWIDLGGQLSRLGNGQETLSPPIMNDRPSMFDPSEPHERSPLYSLDEEGSISFQPKGTDWVFSDAVRYGRASANHDRHQQTYPNPFRLSFTYYGYLCISRTIQQVPGLQIRNCARTKVTWFSISKLARMSGWVCSGEDRLLLSLVSACGSRSSPPAPILR